MNLLYGNQLAVLAETMALCRKSGVDKQQLLSVLQSSDLASPFLVEKAESNDDYPSDKQECCNRLLDFSRKKLLWRTDIGGHLQDYTFVK